MPEGVAAGLDDGDSEAANGAAVGAGAGGTDGPSGAGGAAASGPGVSAPTAENDGTHFHVFRWARTNKLFQVVTSNVRGHAEGLGVGGGMYAALYLDTSLDRGTTGPCETFYSPPLARTQGNKALDDPSLYGKAEVSPADALDLPDSELTPHHLGRELAFRAVDVEVWGFARRVASVAPGPAAASHAYRVKTPRA